MAVGGEGGGGAGVAGFRAGAKWDGEVESEVDCIAHLTHNCWEWTEDLVEGKVQMTEIRVEDDVPVPCKKRNNLLRGAVWKLEEMLVVREVVVQRSILLRGNVLEKNCHDYLSDLDAGDWKKVLRKLLRGWSMAIEQVAGGHLGGNWLEKRSEQQFQQHVPTVIAQKVI